MWVSSLNNLECSGKKSCMMSNFVMISNNIKAEKNVLVLKHNRCTNYNFMKVLSVLKKILVGPPPTNRHSVRHLVRDHPWGLDNQKYWKLSGGRKFKLV